MGGKSFGDWYFGTGKGSRRETIYNSRMFHRDSLRDQLVMIGVGLVLVVVLAIAKIARDWLWR
jgi:hypothetical protein